MPLRLDFTRHGETDWNNEWRLQWSQDIPLNRIGIQQAQLISERLKDEAYDVVITTPLLRARQTAEIILSWSTRKKPLFIVDARFSERNFGDFEWKIRDEVDWDSLLWDYESRCPINWESINQHTQRVEWALKEIEQRTGKVLIVCHWWTIRSLVHLTLWIPSNEIRPVNTAYYSLERNWDWSYRALVENSAKHLKESNI